jgi:hypothetical protein
MLREEYDNVLGCRWMMIHPSSIRQLSSRQIVYYLQTIWMKVNELSFIQRKNGCQPSWETVDRP